MDNIFFNRNYLIKDFDNFVNKIGGRLKLYKTNFYSIWIKNFNKNEHFSKINQISNFVASKDYLLTNKHNEK